MNEWRFPLAEPGLGAGEIAAVTDVLSAGWLSQGEVTEQFERRFAEFCGAKYAVACSSGTAALHLALRSLEIGEGDEVICPSLTFAATVNAVLYCGAEPVLADICAPEEPTISDKEFLRLITPRTRCVLVMHYAGYPCRMDAISEIARKYNIYVVEDACHAVGAEVHGRKCGTIGDVGCFSFFANKNLVTGEGGMLITNDATIAEHARRLRSHAMSSSTWERHHGSSPDYDITALGFNYRMDELRAAIGIVQLQKLEGNNSRRKELARRYHAQLARLPGLRLPFAAFQGVSAHHIMPILLPPGHDRSAFMRTLRQHGIQTSIHYPAVHLLTYYRQRRAAVTSALPLTEEVSRSEVTLPLHPSLTEADVDEICDIVAKCL